MDSKIRFIVIYIGLLILGGAPLAIAGPTSISGTMSCIMPDMLEIKAQNPSPKEAVAAKSDAVVQRTDIREGAVVTSVCEK